MSKSNEYQQFRKLVLKRDNNTCRMCGKTTDLHVHHLFPKQKEPHLITGPMNGITLCVTCHGRVHGTNFEKDPKER